MFEPLIYLILIVAGLAALPSAVALAVSLARGDHARTERVLDFYIRVSETSADALIGALRIFRRKDVQQLPPPNNEHST
jgi:hypothetical protein